jgi:alginate O-acetyltransferase complex protein AlgJ
MVRLGVLLTTALLAIFTGNALARDAVIEGKNNWLFAGWESLTSTNPADEKSSIDLIANVSRILAKRNIKLIALVIPIKPRYYEGLLPDGMRLSDAVRNRYDSLLTELKASAVTAVDARQAFDVVTAEKKDLFYRADFHWTTFAAEAAADQVAAIVKKDGELPGKPGSGTPLGEWINDRHLGDLAANFLTPDRKRAIGPDSYTIRAPAKNPVGLLDSEPAPVAVVGNSFVQPYFGFPQRLSNAIDRPVLLKWNPGDVGPWATFLQLVQSDEFRDSPPRFLLWQFNEGQMQNGPQAVGEWAAPGISDPASWLAKATTAIDKLP